MKTLAELVPGDRLTSRLGGPVQVVRAVHAAPGFDYTPGGTWEPCTRVTVRTDAGHWTSYAGDRVTVEA